MVALVNAQNVAKPRHKREFERLHFDGADNAFDCFPNRRFMRNTPHKAVNVLAHARIPIHMCVNLGAQLFPCKWRSAKVNMPVCGCAKCKDAHNCDIWLCLLTEIRFTAKCIYSSTFECVCASLTLWNMKTQCRVIGWHFYASKVPYPQWAECIVVAQQFPLSLYTHTHAHR